MIISSRFGSGYQIKVFPGWLYRPFNEILPKRQNGEVGEPQPRELEHALHVQRGANWQDPFAPVWQYGFRCPRSKPLLRICFLELLCRRFIKQSEYYITRAIEGLLLPSRWPQLACLPLFIRSPDRSNSIRSHRPSSKQHKERRRGKETTWLYEF